MDKKEEKALENKSKMQKTTCFPQQHIPPLKMNVVNILQHLPLLYGKWLKLLKRI